MTFSSEALAKKADIEFLKDIRIAICGNLPTACKALRDMGVAKIDKFDDGIDACFRLRRGEEYHLILVYAPQAEGIDADMPYKIRCDDGWKSVPIKLRNEPACDSALIELESAVRTIAKAQSKEVQASSG